MNENYHGTIDRLLAEKRPDRYSPHGGDGWLDDIADEVAPLIPPAEARQRLASQDVRARERVKTRRTNKLLRKVFRTGQLPLDWFEFLDFPLAVGKERVAMRAVTSPDFRDFANNERRVAGNDHSARIAACNGAEWVADQMDAAGVQFARDLTVEADAPPSDDDDSGEDDED